MIDYKKNIITFKPDNIFIRFLITAAFLSIFLPGPTLAQSFNVVDIAVEGNKSASEGLILSVAGISKGSQLTASTTQDVVKRLYGLGFFKDVQIDAEEVTGGLSLIIRVKELPKLAGITIQGNDKIKAKDLEKEINLTLGAYVSPNLIFEKKKTILDLYSEKGYFMARVKHDLKYSSDSLQIYLNYSISEGSKVKVEKVILTGNVNVKASDIIGKMRNRKRGFLKSSNFDKEKYPEDKDKIIEYLRKEGYLDAYLKSDSMAIDTARNRMKIYLDIYEGPRYYFGETEWKGNEIVSADLLKHTLKYKKGNVFNREKYDESIYEIYFLYQEQGYLHIRVLDEQKTRDSLIDITFEIVEGLPSEVNLVKITGNTKTKEKVIRREMTIRPGQVFHRSLLIRSVRDIMQLNYFANVTPDIADLPSGDVDILIEVEEKATGQISAGAGYSGEDKFVGTFGLGIPNFRGMGQNLSFNIEFGAERNSYSISFTEPWLFGAPTLLGTDLYYINSNYYDDYTVGRRGGSIKIGRRLTWPDDYFRIYVSYRLEDDRFYDFSNGYKKAYSELVRNQVTFDSLYEYEDPIPDTIKTLSYEVIDYGDPLPGSLERFGENWFSASTVQFTIARDSRDLPEFATRGSVISYTLAYTGNNLLGGYWQYKRHELSISKFIPIWGKIALAGKLTYGTVSGPSDDMILESERYSPGGTGYDGIVRGYDDGSLTPDTVAQTSVVYTYYTSDELDVRPDLDGTPDSFVVITDSYTRTVRGKYMLIGNLELQIPVIENQLYGLLFFDAGNAWLNRNDIKLRNVYRGVGLGFRLVVPGVGTIGFDFGYPLDEREDQSKGWHPHFQVGTTFR